MRIGIIGAGSIGSLVAGCLASTDSNLLLYGRGLHAAEVMVRIDAFGSKRPSNRWWTLGGYSL